MESRRAGRPRPPPPRARVAATAVAAGLLRATRPRHWVKNLLVFVAPTTGGVLLETGGLARAFAAFCALCLAASGSYLLNDAHDAAADRLHPRKARRPVAAGAVTVREARAAGIVLSVVAPALALLTAGRALALVVLTYLLLANGYTWWLKRVAVVEIAAVTGCHLLRALAGAAAVGIPVTGRYLTVVATGCLVLVVGKREAELRHGLATRTRPALRRYQPGALQQIRMLSSGAAVLTYCLWVIDLGDADGLNLLLASIGPFAFALLRVNRAIDTGQGEEPEALLLEDWQMRAAAGLLAACLLAGVELGWEARP